LQTAANAAAAAAAAGLQVASRRADAWAWADKCYLQTAPNAAAAALQVACHAWLSSADAWAWPDNFDCKLLLMRLLFLLLLLGCRWREAVLMPGPGQSLWDSAATACRYYQQQQSWNSCGKQQGALAAEQCSARAR
jgi:hypothetical protein